MKDWKTNILSFLKDEQGKFSRKAIVGIPAFCITVFLITRIIWFKIDIDLMQFHLLKLLLLTSSGLLGLTIFDKIKWK